MNSLSSIAMPKDGIKHTSRRLSTTLLGVGMREGIPIPEEFEQDVLLKGAAHQIFTGPEQGKSWLAKWFIARAIKRGEKAAYLDMENGKRIVTERLMLLGVDPDAVDDHLDYFYVPSLDMTKDSLMEYETYLDEAMPDLIVFDSWIGFLAGCGLDENSPTHVEQWANAYVHTAKVRGCTVVILDHVPHDAMRSRGATRKKDMVDVQWYLEKVEPFDRTTVGYIQLTNKKDRETWLPKRVGFSVGGSEEGFVFKRSQGTVHDQSSDKLPASAQAALTALESFGMIGATYAQWLSATRFKDKAMGNSTFATARKKLMDQERVTQEEDRYYSINSN